MEGSVFLYAWFICSVHLRPIFNRKLEEKAHGYLPSRKMSQLGHGRGKGNWMGGREVERAVIVIGQNLWSFATMNIVWLKGIPVTWLHLWGAVLGWKKHLFRVNPRQLKPWFRSSSEQGSCENEVLDALVCDLGHQLYCTEEFCTTLPIFLNVI